MTLRKILQFIYRAEIPNILLNASIIALCSALFISGISLGLDVVKFTTLPIVFVSFAALYIAHYYYSKNNDFHFNANLLSIYSVVGIVITVTNFFPKIKALYLLPKWGEYIAAFSTLVTVWTIYMLTLALKNVNQQHTADVKNPTISQHTIYSKALAAIFSAMVLALMYKFKLDHFGSYFTITMGVMSFVATFVMTGYYQPIEKISGGSNTNSIESQFDQPTEFSKENLPFLYLFFGFLFTTMVVMTTQMWTGLIGLYEFKESKSLITAEMLSYILFIHSVIYSLVSVISSKAKYSTQKRWFNGYHTLFWSSTILAITHFFTTKPSWMIVSSFITFSIAYPLCKQNLAVLWDKIPRFIRTKVQEINHTYLVGAVCFTIGGIVWLSMTTSLSIKSIWLMMAIFSVTGIAIMGELNRVFSDYHVGNILSGDVYESVECCNLLANPESQGHYMALISILKQNPRPILAKAILKTLGEMKSPEVVDDLIEFYHRSVREDIKVETVKALSNYQSHHIDLFLLEILESIVQDDAFRTEEKRELFHVIANKIANIAIPTVLKILKNNSDNFRIIANSILVLGELAVQTQDETLFYLLSKYLAPIYSRRIRANSTLYLHQHKDFRKYANSCISSLLTSGNEYDRNAVAYIAGELKLESLTPFILEASSKIQHQSSTLLIALLKLGYSTAHQILADRIVHDERNAVIDLLKQINMIKDATSRHAIYFHIFAKYPSKVEHLLEMMSLSEKNFDKDRLALRKEAIKLGIHIKHDCKLFLDKGQLRSVA